MTQFDPVKTVAAAKAAALAEARSVAILNRSGKIYRTKQRIASVVKTIADFTHSIAVIAWEKDQAVKNGNPDAEAIGEKVDEQTKRLNDSVEAYKADQAELEKEVAALETEIADIVSGKKKLDYDNILESSKVFIHDAVKDEFIAGGFDKVVEDAPAADETAE